MDLATAQQHLTDSLDALARARTAQSYGRGSNSLTRASISELQGQVTYWQRVVDALTLSAAGVRSHGAKTASFS